MSLWHSYTVYENPHPVTIAELHGLPPSHLLFSAYSRFVIYLWILSPFPSSAVYLLYQRKTAQFTQINPFCIKMVIDLLTNTRLSQPQLCIAKSWKLQGYRLHDLPWQHASPVLHAVTFFLFCFQRASNLPNHLLQSALLDMFCGAYWEELETFISETPLPQMQDQLCTRGGNRYASCYEVGFTRNWHSLRSTLQNGLTFICILTLSGHLPSLACFSVCLCVTTHN